MLLAKELATLDFLSGGRMILGVGVGWLREEFEALGVPFEGRGRRAEESIAAMRALWSQERASYDGDTTKFVECYLRPQPVDGTIPVHVGGHSPAAARRAGRIGDGFFPFGVTRDKVPALVDIVQRAADEAGRDPSSIELTIDSNLAAGGRGIQRCHGAQGNGCDTGARARCVVRARHRTGTAPLCRRCDRPDLSALSPRGGQSAGTGIRLAK